MQKILSQQDRYVRGIWRNSLSNLVAGAIVFLIIAAIRLLSGCETMIPGEPDFFRLCVTIFRKTSLKGTKKPAK